MYSLITEPYYWNSPYYPLIYEWDYQSKSVSSVTDVSGKVRFTIASAFATTPAVGQKLVVASTSAYYPGIHTITSVVSTTQFLTDTDFDGGTPPSTIKFMEIYEIELYKGYDAGDAHLPTGFDSALPLTLIATFTPENTADNTIRVDVSGYLKNIFGEITFQNLGGTEFSMFNRFRLKYNGSFRSYYHVANTGIDTATLCTFFLDSGRALMRGVKGDSKARYDYTGFYAFGGTTNDYKQRFRVSPTCNNFISYLTNDGISSIGSDGNTLQNP